MKPKLVHYWLALMILPLTLAACQAPTPAATASPVPPSATPVPPTATATATDTASPVPPTATNTATSTSTPVPPTATNTATSTSTPVPPTATKRVVLNTATPKPIVPTEAPTDSGPALGRLVIFECADIENTITIFQGGQIVKQESLHSKDANVYLLPPGHYDVQFNAVGYYNLNLSYDIQANVQLTQYLDGSC